MPSNRFLRLILMGVALFSLLLIGRNWYRRALNERLYQAVSRSDLATVRACIDRHADLHYRHVFADAAARADGSRRTQSVMEAALEQARARQKDADEIAVLLIERGAAGRSVPQLEEICRIESPRLLRYVLEHGPPETTATLNKAIDSVMLNYTYPALDIGNRHALQRQMVQILREHGAQIGAAQAIQLDDPAALHTLLKAPSDRLKKADAAAALCEATRHSDLPMARTLLAHGADVNAENKNGETPLNIAAEQGDRKMVIALLAAHAKRDVRTKWRGAAWENAELTRHYDLARLLWPEKEDVSKALKTLVISGDVEMARAALSKGADVNAGDAFGTTALFYAAAVFADVQASNRMEAEAEGLKYHSSSYGISAGPAGAAVPDMRARKLELMRLLLEHGARADAAYVTGDTPLMLAAQTAPDAVKLLLAHGANVNLHNNHGDTPLMLAARYGNVEAARQLLEKGAEVNARNHTDDTPLILAAKFNPASIPLLLEHHADVHVKARSGYSLLYYVRKRKKPEIIKRLEEAGAKDE